MRGKELSKAEEHKEHKDMAEVLSKIEDVVEVEAKTDVVEAANMDMVEAEVGYSAIIVTGLAI